MDGDRRRLYMAASGLALILSLWGFWGQTRLAVLPERYRGLDVPARLEDIPAATGEELRFLAEGFPPGATVQITDASGTVTRVTLPPAHTRSYLIVTLLSGLCFLGVAAFVFAPKAGETAPRDFFWGTLLYGTAVLIGGVYFPRPPVWPDIVRGVAQLACLGALPVLFFHLVLVFPRRLDLLDRRRWAIPLAWTAAAGAVVWQSWTYLAYALNPAPSRARSFALAQGFADGFLVVLVGAAVVILFTQSRRLVLTRERNQTKWLLWGFTLGITPYVFLRTLPQLMGLHPPVGPALDRVFELAIPAAFVFAVVRYRFLDIDIIIRRSLIYGILAGGLVVLYLALALATERSLGPLDDRTARVILVGTGLLAGVGFFPLRAAIGSWVDRTFFKITHDFESAYRELMPRLETAASQIETADLIARFLEEQIAPRRVEVVVWVGQEPAAVRGTDPETAARWVEAVTDVARPPGEIVTAPASTSLPELESEDFPADLLAAGHVLAGTIGAEGRIAGCIFLGEKTSERRYVETDLRLIASVAAAASPVLRRIELVQAVDAEAQQRRKLKEMTLLKNQFLSQAAHDLRTPLASISWSSTNLLDGIVGPVTESQEEYLRSIKVSSDELNRMVNNLLEISLLEQGAPSLHSQEVNLPAVLSRAMDMVRPLALEKTVDLRLWGEETGAVIHADPEKLFQVAMNLMDNAVKYSPPGSSVEVAVEPFTGGARVFSVRDRGPGLKDAGDRTLFERFRQSDASPYSRRRGFGLGLFIVKSYLELMGGSVEAANHPDGGAVFTCRLPVQGPAAREME